MDLNILLLLFRHRVGKGKTTAATFLCLSENIPPSRRCRANVYINTRIHILTHIYPKVNMEAANKCVGLVWAKLLIAECYPVVVSISGL